MYDILFFAVSFVFYTGYLFIASREQQLDKDLINAMHKISAKLKQKDSVESAIYSLSKGKDLAGELFKKILAEVKSGKSIGDAFSEFDKKSRSSILSCLSRLVNAYDKTEKNIESQLNEMSQIFSELENTEEELYVKTGSAVFVLKLIAVFGAPLFTLFLSTLLNIPLRTEVFVYMGFVALLYSCFDYVMYSDLKKTLFSIPLLISIYILVIMKIAPFVSQFFIGFW